MKRYLKKLPYSYTFGIYPTIELLKKRGDKVKAIYLHSNLEGNESSQTIRKLALRHRVKIEVNNKLIKKLSSKENSYVIGVFEKYLSPMLHGKDNHIVLVEPRNPGNMGTILRSMLAFNFSNLAVITPAVDIFHPTVIRASMGSVFSINFSFFENIDQYIKKFKFHNLYCFLLDTKNYLKKTKFKRPYSLVFGNEGHGLPEKFKKLGTSVKIAQSNNVDSLNLAISTGIGMNWLYKR